MTEPATEKRQWIVARQHLLPVIEARHQGLSSATTSLDLNLTQVELSLADAGPVLPNGNTLAWEAIEKIVKKDNNCFAIDEAGAAEAVHRFSPDFNRGYTLRATASAPTLLIAGFPMHRIKDITPDQDTALKLKAIGRLSGHVLDTTTGLGYTAIAAARQGARVTAVELDPVVLEVGRFNPWSAELFDNPAITQLTGSSFDRIQEFNFGAFITILHDPPTFSLAGDLYSLAFYEQAFRVLRAGGKLFHYVGDLDSRAGRVVSKGVVRRLQEAGFRRVERHPDAFALIALR